MNIKQFFIFSIFVFFVIIGALTAGFYTMQKNTALRQFSAIMNQNVFWMEEEIQQVFRQNRLENIQALLDKAASINDAISVLSLSMDGKTIAVSSSRSRVGENIADVYDPIETIKTGLMEKHQLRYKTAVPLYLQTRKSRAVLLVDINEEYVYGHLNRIALLYAGMLFLVLGLLTLGVYEGVRHWIVEPLERITGRAREKSAAYENHPIEELNILDQSLGDSFGAMQTQQNYLKETLDELRYLDGILRTVADINQYLITAKTMDELIEHSCRRLAEHPGYELCWIALKEGNALVVHSFSDDPTGYLYPRMEIPLNRGAADHLDPSAKAVTLNKTVIFDHLENNSGLGEWRYIAEKGKFGSMIVLPLIKSTGDEPLGVMTIYTKASDGFGPKEIAMLEELAGDIGFAIHSFTQRTQLEYLMSTDSVTDLPNRLSLVEALSHEKMCALAIINIDRFSDINEVYGIMIGDAVLAGYGHWLRQRIASIHNLALFKMGSDEYALLFRGCLDLETPLAFLRELIRATQKETFNVEGIEVVLTVTVGIAPASERILEHATAALKEAKKSRHSLEVFSVLFKAEQENNIAWYKRIKEAVEESRIVPYYHPIVDNQTRQIIKYEALMRMIDQEGEVVSPFQFLEIAKKTKLYPELTKVMISSVVEQLKSAPFPVSLNLSTQDMIDTNLADYLEAVILENGMGQRMVFEILESEGIENYTEVSAFVERFKAIGCRFAIDDFGSGYSNFDHLLKLNIDILKIDGSLIKNLPHDRNAQIFVRHICDFAHEMGISTVAEFVANEEIFHKVREIGIDASQGYYFYEPSPSIQGRLPN